MSQYLRSDVKHGIKNSRVNYLMLLCLLPAIASAEHPSSFSKSKKLLTTIYKGHALTFYCGCTYQRQGKKLIPDLPSCGYQPRKNATRAQRIEWEHVMPAWAFGHQLQCWQAGGRKACKKNKQFKRMESDLHNLVPAIGEVNGDRSNYSFASLSGEPRVYGYCDMEIDFKARKVEPADSVRGDIARTYFYMRDQYDIKLSKKQTQLFTAWHKLDPVDEWEVARNNLIKDVQGNANPYVEGQGVLLGQGVPLESDDDRLLSAVKKLLSLN
jgi:deoxyribonuclease-1